MAANQAHLLSVGAASSALSPLSSSSSPEPGAGATSAANSGDSSSSCKNGIANQCDMDVESDSQICCDEEDLDIDCETNEDDGPSSSQGGRNLPVNRAWKPSEDKKLKELVEKHGPGNWSKLAVSIPGRSGKSCRLRWYNQLSPEVKQVHHATSHFDCAIQR